LAAVVVMLVWSGGRDGSRRFVTVDGARAWTDSGIEVNAGDNVTVTASGTVFHNETSAIGPEGFPNRPELLTPLATANHAGLLGKVGSGDPFYIGARGSFTADHDGRLLLGINDGGLENNHGAFRAALTVSRN
jgi:hypothetical protein